MKREGQILRGPNGSEDLDLYINRKNEKQMRRGQMDMKKMEGQRMTEKRRAEGMGGELVFFHVIVSAPTTPEITHKR